MNTNEQMFLNMINNRTEEVEFYDEVCETKESLIESFNQYDMFTSKIKTLQWQIKLYENMYKNDEIAKMYICMDKVIKHYIYAPDDILEARTNQQLDDDDVVRDINDIRVIFKIWLDNIKKI